MTDKAISPLRRRTIDDMTIRKLGPKTQAGYIRTVKNLSDFLGHSPDRGLPRRPTTALRTRWRGGVEQRALVTRRALHNVILAGPRGTGNAVKLTGRAA